MKDHLKRAIDTHWQHQHWCQSSRDNAACDCGSDQAKAALTHELESLEGVLAWYDYQNHRTAKEHKEIIAINAQRNRATVAAMTQIQMRNP